MISVPDTPLLPDDKASVQPIFISSGNVQSSIENGRSISESVQQGREHPNRRLPRPRDKSVPLQTKAERDQKEQFRKWQRLSRAITGEDRKSQRYIKYRERQRKEKGEDGKEKWSAEMDDAFQMAIRIVNPIGRQKLMNMQINGQQKLCGTNELIAKEIYRLTGERRNRKQISSHIQVLDNLIKDVENEAIVDGPRSPKSENFNDIDYEWNSLRPSSGNDALGCYQSSENHRDTSLVSQRIPIRRVQFHMCVYPPFARDASHLYTTMQSEIGAQSRSLKQDRDWRSNYPGLARIAQTCQPLTSEIILLEASLALMEDLPPKGSSLSIHLFADLADQRLCSTWSSRTTFFEATEAKDVCLKTLNVVQDDLSGCTRLEIPLESTWWVRLFHQITARRHEVQASCNSRLRENPHIQCCCDACETLGKAAQYALDKEEENTRRYLREMSITQELFIGSPSSCPETILVWRFRQTHPYEAATTTWRRLIPLDQDSHQEKVALPTMHHYSTMEGHLESLPLSPSPTAHSSSQQEFLYHLAEGDLSHHIHGDQTHQLGRSDFPHEQPYHYDLSHDYHNHDQAHRREEWETLTKFHPDLFAKPAYLSPSQHYPSPTHTLPSSQPLPTDGMLPYPKPFLPSQPLSRESPGPVDANFPDHRQSHSQESFTSLETTGSLTTVSEHGLVEMNSLDIVLPGTTDPSLEDFSGGHIELAYDIGIAMSTTMPPSMAIEASVHPVPYGQASLEHENSPPSPKIIAPTAQIVYPRDRDLEQELLQLERNHDLPAEHSPDDSPRCIPQLPYHEVPQSQEQPIPLSEADEHHLQIQQEMAAIQEVQNQEMEFEPSWGTFPPGLFTDAGFGMGEFEVISELGEHGSGVARFEEVEKKDKAVVAGEGVRVGMEIGVGGEGGFR